MTRLPALRVKILRSFLVVVGLYALLGAVLMAVVLAASGTTPKVIHVNYDSIAAAQRMRHAWNSLRGAGAQSQNSPDHWRREFESALRFAESNVTEPGEREVTAAIRGIWGRQDIDAGAASDLDARLSRLVTINEEGMFRLARDNEQLSRRVLIGAIAYFLLTLVLAVLYADSLASRLALPAKRIAEVLRGKPKLGSKLRLPEPTSLEFLILSHELRRLWDRFSEANKFNVTELVGQKTKLETVLASIEDALLVLDDRGVVSHVNGCFLQLLGLSAGQVIGQAWRDLPSVQDNYLKLREALSENLPEACELDLLHEGRPVHYAVRARGIEAGHSRKIGKVFLLHDVTEKRQRDKLRTEIIDVLSHELKTPLQSLGTASDVLNAQKAAFPPEARLLLETIAEDVDRLRAVAGEFLQLTQAQARTLKLRLEPQPVSQKMLEWLKPFAVVARDRRVQLDYRQSGSDVIWANIDPVKFPWAVSNLLSNALRFSAPDSRMSVTLSDKGGRVEIQVQDAGPGVSLEDQARIFDPFYQAPGPESGRGLFGLGLTIAKEIVEAHEGSLEYRPASGQGSVFCITLPRPS